MSAGSALFDTPGPRGRMTVRVVTFFSIVAILLAFGYAIHLFQVNKQFEWYRWELMTQPAIIRYIGQAFGRTLLAAAGGAAIALPLGLILAVGRLSKNRLIRWPSAILVEFFRAVPLLLIIYIFFFALPHYKINPDMFWKLVIPIGLCDGALIAEVFRAGILAVPKGQAEAGAAVGLTESQTFGRIVFPQAVRMVVPSLVAQIVILLKDTTLGYAVSYNELLQSAQLLTNTRTSSLVQTYLVISLIYVLTNLIISLAARRLDSRWATRRAPRTRTDAQAPIAAGQLT